MTKEREISLKKNLRLLLERTSYDLGVLDQDAAVLQEGRLFRPVLPAKWRKAHENIRFMFQCCMPVYIICSIVSLVPNPPPPTPPVSSAPRCACASFLALFMPVMGLRGAGVDRVVFCVPAGV